jgi:hypothetical protein
LAHTKRWMSSRPQADIFHAIEADIGGQVVVGGYRRWGGLPPPIQIMHRNTFHQKGVDEHNEVRSHATAERTATTGEPSTD